MTIKERVLDQVRRAFPDAVETDVIRASYGEAGAKALSKLARAGELEHVRSKWYRAKSPAEASR